MSRGSPTAGSASATGASERTLLPKRGSGRCRLSSLPSSDPYRCMRRFDGPVDDLEEVGPHGLEIDGVSQPGGKARNGRLGVIARAVETTIDEALDAASQRAEKSN